MTTTDNIPEGSVEALDIREPQTPAEPQESTPSEAPVDAQAQAPEVDLIATFLDAYTREVKALQAQVKALRKRGKQVFTDACAAAFQKHPILDEFSWRQFTPYFNDGDACVFRVDRDGLCVNGEEFWYMDKKDIDPELAAAMKTVETIYDAMSDDDYEEYFGDHAEITVTASGVQVSRCSHD